jgi:hypothetical protein
MRTLLPETFWGKHKPLVCSSWKNLTGFTNCGPAGFKFPVLAELGNSCYRRFHDVLYSRFFSKTKKLKHGKL